MQFNERLYEVLIKVREITTMEDIGCHKVEDGEIYPVYKFDTETLPVDFWKESHAKIGLKVKDHWVLENVVYNKNTFYAKDINELPNAPAEFIHFKLRTLLVIPIIKDDATIGLVAIGSVGKVTDLSDDQISQCEELVHEYCKTI